MANSISRSKYFVSDICSNVLIKTTQESFSSLANLLKERAFTLEQCRLLATKCASETFLQLTQSSIVSTVFLKCGKPKPNSIIAIGRVRAPVIDSDQFSLLSSANIKSVNPAVI